MEHVGTILGLVALAVSGAIGLAASLRLRALERDLEATQAALLWTQSENCANTIGFFRMCVAAEMMGLPSSAVEDIIRRRLNGAQNALQDGA